MGHILAWIENWWEVRKQNKSRINATHEILLQVIICNHHLGHSSLHVIIHPIIKKAPAWNATSIPLPLAWSWILLLKIISFFRCQDSQDLAAPGYRCRSTSSFLSPQFQSNERWFNLPPRCFSDQCSIRICNTAFKQLACSPCNHVGHLWIL